MNEYGVKINGMHTYQGWGLKCLEVSIGIPESEKEKIKQLSGNTYTVVSGEGQYEQRQLRIVLDHEDTMEQWQQKLSEIAGKINGKEVVVELDSDPGAYYIGTATVVTEKKDYTYSDFEISVMVDPFKYKDYISVTAPSSGKVTAETDFETPCIIEITAIQDNSELTITGVARDPITGEDEPIIVKNLKKDIPVIVDGETCTVTQQGANKYPETDFWEFPSLLPGENQITLSNALNTVTIKYRPRYI